MFFPGETITHSFIIPFTKREVQKIILSYKQDDQIVFEKEFTSEDVTDEQTSPGFAKLTHSFKQDESLSFNDNYPFTIQCNVLTIDGTRHTSQVVKGSNGVQYYREVIPYESGE